MSDIKYMDINEFRLGGFLQEVNRQFFHPLGLALEVVMNDDGTETLGGIWDCREDPEGIVFGAGDIEDRKEKAQNVTTEANRHAGHRMRMYGWVIQPLDAEVELNHNA